jgi:hypothetical protein
MQYVVIPIVSLAFLHDYVTRTDEKIKLFDTWPYHTVRLGEIQTPVQ